MIYSISNYKFHVSREKKQTGLMPSLIIISQFNHMIKIINTLPTMSTYLICSRHRILAHFLINNCKWDGKIPIRINSCNYPLSLHHIQPQQPFEEDMFSICLNQYIPNPNRLALGQDCKLQGFSIIRIVHYHSLLLLQHQLQH